MHLTAPCLKTVDQIWTLTREFVEIAFDYTEDGIDMERDLVIPPISEPNFDKHPNWIPGALPRMKCEIGRIMAREDIPQSLKWLLRRGPYYESISSFELLDGTIKGPWKLEQAHALDSNIQQANGISEMNRLNRERQMKQPPTSAMPNFPGQPRRFYMAGLARFVTAVREAEWLGGEHPYSYALNDPVGYKDPSGLHPAIGCSDPCKSACDKVISEYPTACGKIESPNYPPGSVTYAFAFCCDGKPSYCLCPGMNTENPYIKACINVHERGHVAPGGCAPGYTGPPTKTYDECTALKAGIKCAAEQCRKLISNDCIQLEDWRCAECKRLKYACRPMPDASWLSKYCKGCRVQ